MADQTIQQINREIELRKQELEGIKQGIPQITQRQLRSTGQQDTIRRGQIKKYSEDVSEYEKQLLQKESEFKEEVKKYEAEKARYDEQVRAERARRAEAESLSKEKQVLIYDSGGGIKSVPNSKVKDYIAELSKRGLYVTTRSSTALTPIYTPKGGAFAYELPSGQMVSSMYAMPGAKAWEIDLPSGKKLKERPELNYEYITGTGQSIAPQDGVTAKVSSIKSYNINLPSEIIQTPSITKSTIKVQGPLTTYKPDIKKIDMGWGAGEETLRKYVSYPIAKGFGKIGVTKERVADIIVPYGWMAPGPFQKERVATRELSKEFILGGIEGIKESPLKTAVATGIGFGSQPAARGLTFLASTIKVSPKIATAAKTAYTFAPYVLGGLYAGAKTKEIMQEPTARLKARKAGAITTTEVIPFLAGAELSQKYLMPRIEAKIQVAELKRKLLPEEKAIFERRMSLLKEVGREPEVKNIDYSGMKRVPDKGENIITKHLIKYSKEGDILGGSSAQRTQIYGIKRSYAESDIDIYTKGNEVKRAAELVKELKAAGITRISQVPGTGRITWQGQKMLEYHSMEDYAFNIYSVNFGATVKGSTSLTPEGIRVMKVYPYQATRKLIAGTLEGRPKDLADFFKITRSLKGDEQFGLKIRKSPPSVKISPPTIKTDVISGVTPVYKSYGYDYYYYPTLQKTYSLPLIGLTGYKYPTSIKTKGYPYPFGYNKPYPTPSKPNYVPIPSITPYPTPIPSITPYPPNYPSKNLPPYTPTVYPPKYPPYTPPSYPPIPKITPPVVPTKYPKPYKPQKIPFIPSGIFTRKGGMIKQTKAELFKKIRGYKAYLKRFGKWQLLSTKVLPKQEAIKLGEKAARFTLGATFKIEPTKKVITGVEKFYEPSPRVFRAYKIRGLTTIPLRDTWIQKRKTRLGTYQEVKAIQAAKRNNLFNARGVSRWM